MPLAAAMGACAHSKSSARRIACASAHCAPVSRARATTLDACAVDAMSVSACSTRTARTYRLTLFDDDATAWVYVTFMRQVRPDAAAAPTRPGCTCSAIVSRYASASASAGTHTRTRAPTRARASSVLRYRRGSLASAVLHCASHRSCVAQSEHIPWLSGSDGPSTSNIPHQAQTVRSVRPPMVVIQPPVVHGQYGCPVRLARES